MSVLISSVASGSPAEKAGIKPNDTLLSINKNDIIDVLDYRFWQNEKRVVLKVQRMDKTLKFRIKKQEYEELGLEFETYLMDKQRSCKNKCIFCFIDQLPKGMRESLYFKDDDSRLSFLFGNYITLTNLTEHEVDRIIKMHISPVNVSVHTTNPELRQKMMKNKNAGNSLEVLTRLNKAGIALNCQLVLCPGINDGDELRRSLNDLTALQNVGCIAAVPVGLTDYREGLENLEPYTKESAIEVLNIIDQVANECENSRGDRIVYASDEFYIKAGREIPSAEFYGDFLQLENGVGLIALLVSEVDAALISLNDTVTSREVGIVTGVDMAPFMEEISEKIMKKWQNLKVNVYPIVNNFFGTKITVTGLLTAKDTIDQLKGKSLGEEILLSESMFNTDGVTLDDKTKEDIEKALNTQVKIVKNDGYELVSKIANI